MKVKNRLVSALVALVTMGHSALSSFRKEEKEQKGEERFLSFEVELESVDEVLLKNTLNSIECCFIIIIFVKINFNNNTFII